MSINKKYCFNETEFMVIAASLGIRKMYGFMTPIADSEDITKSVKAVFSILKKGFIYPDEKHDYYCVTDEIREIFEGIRECRNILTVASSDESFGQKCLFCKDKVTVLETGYDTETYVKGCCDTKKNVAKWLAEDDILLSGTSNTKEFEQCQKAEKADIKELYDNINNSWNLQGKLLHKALKDNGLKIVLEKLGENDYIPVKKMLFFEGMIEDYIALQEASKTKVWIYSKPLAEKLLLKLMEEFDKGDSS